MAAVRRAIIIEDNLIYFEEMKYRKIRATVPSIKFSDSYRSPEQDRFSLRKEARSIFHLAAAGVSQKTQNN